MIIPEYIIRDITAQIPHISLRSDVQRKPQFSWGDKLELNRYLELKKEDSYPLIWLLPDEDHHYFNGDYCKRRLEIIVATLEADKNLYNPERYNKSFRIVLNPLADQIVKGLTDSGVTTIIEEKWDIFKYPNYTDSEGKNENGTIELWDALKITFNEVEFSNNCINTKIWQ